MRRVGGHTEHRAAAPKRVAVAILTVSDTRTPTTDSSGHYLAQAVASTGHHVTETAIVPDEELPHLVYEVFRQGQGNKDDR